jgi:Phage major capsid protein E
MAAPFDIWDQAAMTDLVVRPLTTQFEDQPRLGDVLMPVKSIQARTAKLRTRQTLAFGLGQFRAPDSTPGLYKPTQQMQDTVVELALLDEMERIAEEQWMQLNSSDQNIRLAAGVDLVDRGKILMMRNERLTEWMRWQVLTTGTLTITLVGGNQIFIDYGIPALNKATVTTLWSDTTNSDPIADIKAWSARLASASGYYGLHLHMSSDTYDLMVQNAKIKALLTATNRSLLIPRQDDILTLLRDGTTITLYDNGYRADTVGTARGVPDSLTRFLPKGKVLMTTDYSIEGTPIAETLDGQVTISTGWNEVAIKQGPQSEVLLDHMSKTHYWRQASARIPRVIYPECLFIGTVA